MKKRMLVYCFVLVISLIVIGCGQASEKKITTVESFTLSEYDTTEIEVQIDEHDTISIYILPSTIDKEDVELVNSNEEIALCILQDVRGVPTGNMAIVSYRGMSVGEATIYLKDKNSEKKSEEIHISVIEKIVEQDNSPKVFLNREGDKYHYSESCAGNSAYESTLNAALKLRKEACSKCAK